MQWVAGKIFESTTPLGPHLAATDDPGLAGGGFALTCVLDGEEVQHAETELQLLSAGHAPAVLAFEWANRAYFAASVSDRGDDFFDRFIDRNSALLAEQKAGIGVFYVLVAEDVSVLGRFNLVFVEDGSAELGYRVARYVAGWGVANAPVRELGRLAAVQHGMRRVGAAIARGNAASRKVLTKTVSLPVGPADLGGKPGT